MASKRVTFIGPESRVYHSDAHCSALKRRGRYWPAHRGWINAEGAILGEDGRVYLDRRPCKRCAR